MKKFAFLFLTALCFMSCKVAYDETNVYLDQDWQYSLEENGEYTQVPMQKIRDLQEMTGIKKGYVYLRYEFDGTKLDPQVEYGLYLGRITLADETWLNGVYIGGDGSSGEHLWSAWNTTRLYGTPTSIINFEGKNALDVKVWIEGEGSVVSDLYIGRYTKAKHRAVIHNFWNSEIYMLFAFTMLVIAGYHLVLYFNRKKDTENLTFAIINIVTALYLVVFFIDEFPNIAQKLNFLWFQKIFSDGLTFVIPCLASSFINEFSKRRCKKAVGWIRFAFVLIPIFIVFSARSYEELRLVRGYTKLFLLPPLAYIIYQIVYDAIHRQKGSFAIGMGFSPLMVAIFADLFCHNVIYVHDLPFLFMYGWMTVIFTFLFILGNIFASARNQVEELNAHLEQKVKDRTEELSKANEQLSAINAAAEKDMKLAVYVQRSFFPKNAPKSDEWDIAYIFNPMAGVSGDLFDFFTEKNQFMGTALFDVSGHGISSGLVTMLSKAIISHEFENGKDKKLSDVMYSLNERICEDKGDVENYMTGILLRVNGNTVDYVNGGHPSLLLRTASGKVTEASLANGEGGGSLVGMRDLPVEYKTVRFKMNKGDAMLLYTDCLQESRNINDEEITTEGVKEAFAKAGGSTAQLKLDSVLSTFNKFTEGKPLKDDLTAILIVKK